MLKILIHYAKSYWNISKYLAINFLLKKTSVVANPLRIDFIWTKFPKIMTMDIHCQSFQIIQSFPSFSRSFHAAMPIMNAYLASSEKFALLPGIT